MQVWKRTGALCERASPLATLAILKRLPLDRASILRGHQLTSSYFKDSSSNGSLYEGILRATIMLTQKYPQDHPTDHAANKLLAADARASTLSFKTLDQIHSAVGSLRYPPRVEDLGHGSTLLAPNEELIEAWQQHLRSSPYAFLLKLLGAQGPTYGVMATGESTALLWFPAKASISALAYRLAELIVKIDRIPVVLKRLPDDVELPTDRKPTM